MKRAMLILITGLTLISLNVFAQNNDVFIDENGNLTTGYTNQNDGKLEVIGSSGKDAIVGLSSGTGMAFGIYGEHTTSGNYGYVGSEVSGVYGFSSTFFGKGVSGVSSDSNGHGVYGLNNINGNFGYLGANNVGVGGESTSGVAVFGSTSSGSALYGTSSGNGYGLQGVSNTGTAGYFRSTSGYGLIVGNGNVGIGTSSPAYNLDVTGTINASTAIKINGVDVLTSYTDTTCLDGGITCNFAGSSFEGGPATTALLLNANGSNCAAGSYAIGVDQSGSAEGCTADDDQPDNDAEVPNAITVSGEVTSSANINLNTTVSTISGRISYDSSGDRLAVGDGTGVDYFYPGQHTVEIDPKVGSNLNNYLSKWNGSALVDGSIYDNGNVGIGTTIPEDELHVAGDIRQDNTKNITMTRTMPMTVGNAIDIGFFAFTGAGPYGGTLWVTVNVGAAFPVQKTYIIPVSYNQTANTWQTVLPIAASYYTPSKSANDFELEMRVATGTAYLRLHRTAGTTSHTAFVVIRHDGREEDAFTQTFASGPVTAPTDILKTTALTQVGLANTSSNVGIGTISPNYPLEMGSGAHVTIGGVWTNASSREYKENIRELSVNSAINTLNGLNPVEYNYKVDKSEHHVGFIAEEVPDLVATQDRKSLSPMDIVAVLTKVTQEQERVNHEQQREMQAQEKTFNNQLLQQQKIISKLTERLNKLEREVNLKGSLASVMN